MGPEDWSSGGTTHCVTQQVSFISEDGTQQEALRAKTLASQPSTHIPPDVVAVRQGPTMDTTKGTQRHTVCYARKMRFKIKTAGMLVPSALKGHGVKHNDRRP